MPDIKKVISTSHHRNGICGSPFYVTVFEDEDGRRMVGIYFPNHDKDYATAVFDLDLLNENIVEFGVNSFRGDKFQEPLKRIIKDEFGSSELE